MREHLFGPLLGTLSVVGAVIWSGLPAIAQSAPDTDRAGYAVHLLRPNGTHDGQPAYIVRGPLELSGRTVRVEGSSGSRCDLVIEDGGSFQLRDAKLEVRGDVRFEEGGSMFLDRVECSVRNSYPREFGYQFKGGLLHTQDCVIGGSENSSGASQNANIWLSRGHWTVRNTVVQFSGGILLGSRKGQGGNPDLRGGSLDADGLHQGKSADYLILWGNGDASLRNSTFAISLGLWADVAGNTLLDLRTDRPVGHRVYGDRTLHDGYYRDPVSENIPGTPWRLQLDEVEVTQWAVAIHDVRTNGPDFGVTLRNASTALVRLLTEDLQGSPVLTGSWRTFYPSPRSLPGLPSAREPGEHGIPPGCGVRIGNATVKAPANEWVYPRSWEFNFKGAATNFTIRGAQSITEMYIKDATVTLEGDEQYNAGLRATTYELHGDARLNIRNATVGTGSGAQAEILASGRSVVDMRDVTLENLLIRTRVEPFGTLKGVDASRITIRDFQEAGTVTSSASSGSPIDFVRANRDQAFDLNNLDFEEGISSGNPAYWRTSNVSGWSGTAVRSTSSGQAAYRYQGPKSTGSVSKTISIAKGAGVEFCGWLNPKSVPNRGKLEVFVRGASGRELVASPTLQTGQWKFFQLPSFVVGANESPVEFGVRHSGTNGLVDVLLDDFDLRVTRWWVDDNLRNLGFDEPTYRYLAEPSGGWSRPNNWQVWAARAERESSDRRPGAKHGSYATRLWAENSSAQLFKNFSFLEPGQTLVVSGWVKALPNAAGPYGINIHIGEDDGRWWDSSRGNNAHARFWDGAWHEFRLTYVVPSGSMKAERTRLAFTLEADVAQILVDDVTVEIR